MGQLYRENDIPTSHYSQIPLINKKIFSLLFALDWCTAQDLKSQICATFPTTVTDTLYTCCEIPLIYSLVTEPSTSYMNSVLVSKIVVIQRLTGFKVNVNP